MANFEVHDIDEELYFSLKKLAVLEKRSVSEQVVYILSKYLSSPESFLQFSGSWEDDRTAQDIVAEIRGDRR